MREKLKRLLDIHYGIEHVPVNEEWIRSFWSWKCGLSTWMGFGEKWGRWMT